MRTTCKSVMCTAIKEPRPYKFDDGREGVSYKVEMSDGLGSVEFAVTEAVYLLFVPFKIYDITIEFNQVTRATQYGQRKDIKARIVEVTEV